MRKILVPFALLGLGSFPMVACDVEDTGNDATTNTNTTNNTTDTGGDTTVETKYYAVVVDDSVQFPEHRSDNASPCATSSVDAHGADIDAVELVDGNNASLGYLSTVVLRAGTLCNIAAKYADSNEAKGAPDGTLLENFVSLGGGSISGEFTASSLEILPGYEIIVYEVGVAEGGIDEEYTVSITENASCTTNCDSVEIGDGAGESSFSLSGF